MFFNNFFRFLWKYELFKALFGDDRSEQLLMENRALRDRINDLDSTDYLDDFDSGISDLDDTGYCDYLNDSEYYLDNDFDSYNPLADDPDIGFDDFDDY